MAEFTAFPLSNTILRGNGDNVKDIPVWRDEVRRIFIGKVAFDPKELEEIAKTGAAWVQVLGGWPPMLVSGLPLLVTGEEADVQMRLEEAEKTVKGIRDALAQFPPSMFDGENIVAEMMRKLRAEAFPG